MQQINYHDYLLQVNNGILSSNNPQLLKWANAILASSFGQFNNSEVYPDKDSAIAHYLSLQLLSK